MEDIEKIEIPFCMNPWKYLNIYDYGKCIFCREDYMQDQYYLGNILKHDIDEIWNGERAQKIRQSILDGSKTFCREELCNRQYDTFYNRGKKFEFPNSVIAPYPEIISMRYDTNCNQRCIFCKDRPKQMYRGDVQEWDEIIESKLIPICANAKLLLLGETFESEHSKRAVSKILATYPNLQTDIDTIAVAFNAKNVEELNLKHRIRTLSLKLHAATSATYKAVWRSDDFDKAIENIEYACQLRDNGEIRHLSVDFAVNSKNYQDMKHFARMARKYDFNANFIVTPHGNTDYINFTKEYAVYNEESYHYNKFLKILKDNVFLYDNINLHFPQNLKPVSPICTIKNFIQAKYENFQNKNNGGF